MSFRGRQITLRFERAMSSPHESAPARTPVFATAGAVATARVPRIPRLSPGCDIPAVVAPPTASRQWWHHRRHAPLAHGSASNCGRQPGHGPDRRRL